MPATHHPRLTTATRLVMLAGLFGLVGMASLATAAHALSGPAGVSRDVSDKIIKALYDTMTPADMVKRMEDMGIAMKRMTQAEFTAFVAKQVAECGPAVKASGATLN